MERDARQLALLFEKRRYLILACLTLFYLAAAFLHARAKPLWYDEIITVIAAAQPDIATAWKAARATDASPPLPHLLTHFAIAAFGKNDVAVRAPAIAGFWIFCLCLYRFVRRRAGIFYAFAALLLPIATEAYNYSVEARAYAPELAFIGIALVAWQSATEGVRRGAACCVLALGLILAVLCHYYALLVVLPLAGGEAIRARAMRRIDWPVWAAFAAAPLPVIWNLATVVGVVHGFVHTWATPYPEQAVEFWESGLQHLLVPLALYTALMALAGMKGGTREARGDGPELRHHELAAGVLFLVIPVLAVGAALLITHSLALRYILFALTGFLLLAPLLLAHLTRGSVLPGFLLFLASAAFPVYAAMESPPAQNPYRDEPILAEALKQGPVVIPDGQLFLRMWYYAPPEVRQRLLFLADDAAALKYMDFETIDSGLRDLTPWSSVPVRPFADYAASHPTLMVYQNLARPGWLVSKALADGGEVQLQKYTPVRALLRVHLAAGRAP